MECWVTLLRFVTCGGGKSVTGSCPNGCFVGLTGLWVSLGRGLGREGELLACASLNKDRRFRSCHASGSVCRGLKSGT